MIKRFLKMALFPVMPLYGGGGKGGGSSKSQEQVQTVEPWSGQQPYLRHLFKEAKGIYKNDTPEYYGDSTIADQSGQTLQAQNLIESRALNGSQLVDSSKDLNQSMINGDFLNSNPYLDAQYDRAASAVTRNFREGIAPSIDSQFAGAGRYGSEAYNNSQDRAQDNLGRTLEGMATEMYGNNYAQERSNQINAGLNSMAFANNDYSDLSQLAGVGNALDLRAQDVLNADIARHDFEQNAPMQNLANYSAIVNNGNYGSTSTITNSGSGGGSNTLGNIAGGAATGFSIGGPWGAAAGGVLGGLLG